MQIFKKYRKYIGFCKNARLNRLLNSSFEQIDFKIINWLRKKKHLFKTLIVVFAFNYIVVKNLYLNIEILIDFSFERQRTIRILNQNFFIF